MCLSVRSVSHFGHSSSFAFFTDRFRDHQGQRVTSSCFLPFGAGPRVCVGESLARLELFLFLSSLLQRMSFRLPNGASPPDLQGRMGVVLQPVPYKVVVTPRVGWRNASVCQSFNKVGVSSLNPFFIKCLTRKQLSRNLLWLIMNLNPLSNSQPIAMKRN